MNNVVYLLGAGASSGALPVVKAMPKVMQETIDDLESNLHKAEITKGYWDGNDKDERKHAHRILIDDLKWLHASTLHHASVDTLAKKLFLTRKTQEYRRLKAALTAFLFIRQVLNPPDPRYDAFLASILTADLMIPGHVKIVTWNYDFQFEKVFSSYIDTTNLGIAQNKLGIAQKFIPNKALENKSIFKINGSTYIKHSFGGVSLYSFVDPNESKPKFLHDFSVSYYGSVHKEKNNHLTLSFAWEDDNFIDQVKAVFDGSNILVIVGYSFPFFNRDVDSRLLSQMPIDKVYIQDLDPETVWSRLKAIRPELSTSKLEKIQVNKDDPGQFHLPFEI